MTSGGATVVERLAAAKLGAFSADHPADMTADWMVPDPNAEVTTAIRLQFFLKSASSDESAFFRTSGTLELPLPGRK